METYTHTHTHTYIYILDIHIYMASDKKKIVYSWECKYIDTVISTIYI